MRQVAYRAVAPAAAPAARCVSCREDTQNGPGRQRKKVQPVLPFWHRRAISRGVDRCAIRVQNGDDRIAATHDRIVIAVESQLQKRAMIQELSSGTVCASPPAMDPAHASAATPPTVTFHDGLGERHHVVDRATNEPIEILCLRSELTAVPSFEFALRERVSHLSTFRHALLRAGPERRAAEEPDLDAGAGLGRRPPACGCRTSSSFAEKAQVTLDIDAALCLLRQLVPAVAMLHENAPEIAHGAIAAERIIVTPAARIVVVEHVLGSAIARAEIFVRPLLERAAGGGARASAAGAIRPPLGRHADCRRRAVAHPRPRRCSTTRRPAGSATSSRRRGRTPRAAASSRCRPACAPG